jgi:hypothetical protein
MTEILCTRRRLLALGASAPAAWLAGCGTPLPLGTAPPGAGDADGTALLHESADAHGWAAYRTLADINIAYGGQWRPVIDRIQPVVVDKAYRGPSQERLLPQQGVVAQSYRGPAGRKHVWWRRGRDGAAGEVGVWYDGVASRDPAVLAASSLVAEAYGLFLLGPLWARSRGLVARRDGSERFDGRLHDRLQLWAAPGLGRVALDRVTLLVDRATRITHRVRFTLEGFSATQGAVAEVDTFDHERRFGVLWPMRSYEEVVHPLRLPAHDWFVSGLDVNRGYDADALRGPDFAGAAAAPARPV